MDPKAPAVGIGVPPSPLKLRAGSVGIENGMPLLIRLRVGWGGIAVLALFLAWHAQAAPSPSPRKSKLHRISVLTLDGSLSAARMDSLTRRLIYGINLSRDFMAMNLDTTRAVLKRKGIEPSPCGDAQCGQRAGRALGVDMAVVGYIGQAGSNAFITLHIIDSQTGDMYRGTTMDFSGSFARLWSRGILDAAAAVVGELALVQETLETAKPRGDLHVASDPPGAEIYLDSVLIDKKRTPASLFDIPAGKHTLEVVLGGQRQVEKIHLKPGAFLKVSMILPRIKPVGRLRIDTSPKGARVFVDGRYVGNTPLDAGNIDAGSRRLRLAAKGFKPYFHTVRIWPGQTQKLTIKLAAIPSLEEAEKMSPRQKSIMSVASFLSFAGYGAAAGYYHWKGVDYYRNYWSCTSPESIKDYKKKSESADQKRNIFAAISAASLAYGIRLTF